MPTRLKNIFILVMVIAAIGLFFYIARFLGGGESVESEKPTVICRPQNAPPEKQECFWTAHIHAHVEVSKGGEELPTRFEEGELEGQHTHSEPNKLHWHGLIPVDPKTKEVTDWSVLEVQKIVTDFNFSQEGTPKFMVNNKEVDPSYVWQDDDHIEIYYK